MLVDFTENLDDQIDDSKKKNTTKVEYLDTSEDEMHPTVTDRKSRSTKKRPLKKPKNLPIKVNLKRIDKDLETKIETLVDNQEDLGIRATTKIVDHRGENYPDLLVDLDSVDRSDEKGKDLTNQLKNFRKPPKIEEKALKIESSASENEKFDDQAEDNYPDLMVPPDDSIVNENSESDSKIDSSEIDKQQPSGSKTVNLPAKKREFAKSRQRNQTVTHIRRSTRSRKQSLKS